MDTNPYLSPANVDDGGSVVDAGVWRDGDYLVVRSKRHALADRCVICNAPALGNRYRLNLSWLPREGRKLAPASIIGGPAVDLFVRLFARKARVRIGLCPAHLWRKRWGFFFAWFSMPVAVAYILFAAEHGFTEMGPLIAIGIFAIIGTLYGYFASRLLIAMRIDRGFVWVQGVCRDYLAQVGEIPQE